MKQFSNTQLALFHQLADGQCHSSTTIGKQLALSQTEVETIIEQLATLGLPVKHIAHQGYQLTQPMQPLDEQLIRQYLSHKHMDKALSFHLFATIDSTNRFLKELPHHPSVAICCAEKQTNGRGRFARHWISPFGENIYCSSRWRLTCCLSRLSGLSLVVALAIVASLQDEHIHENIRIKWPNDIVWGQKKLAGILVEVMPEANHCVQVIIGIGINVNTRADAALVPDKPWTSLYGITGQYMDRNRLLANLFHHLNRHLERFLASDFSVFYKEWQQVDYLYDQFISIAQPSGSIQGYACGINEFGQLALRDEAGVIHYFSSGDTSITSLR